MRRPLIAALTTALTLAAVPAFADIAPAPDDTVQVVAFFAFAAGILVVAVWLLYRVRRRR